MRGMDSIVDRALRYRDAQAIAKVITAIETNPYSLRRYSGKLFRPEVRSNVLVVTGPPGVGKSSLINHLIRELRREGYTVAVLAIDPASPFSGGSFLGNRVRVRTLNEGTYFRSMSSPPEEVFPWKAVLTVEFLNSVGFDYVIVESPGAGQSNVKFMELGDVTVVVLQPLTGDDIQALKAGVMEIGDVYVLNKADLPQAELTYMQLESVVKDLRRGGWAPPLVRVNSISGRGVRELVKAINDFLSYARSEGLLNARRFRRRLAEVREIALENIRALFYEFVETPMANRVVEEVARGRKDLLEGSEEILKAFTEAVKKCWGGGS